MTTKAVSLPRLLPGLRAARPTAGVASYWMPRERSVAYAIGFSALLHAAVLFGIDPPETPTPRVAIRSADPVARLWKDAVLLAAEPPPAPVAAVVKATTPTDEAAAKDAGVTRASIPEHIIDAAPGAIMVAGRFDRGVEPDSGRLVWTPPLSGAPVNRSDVPLINEKDLDTKPVATTRAAPNYPSEAKRLGLSGTVVLRFIVDHRGNVAEVEVVNADHPEFVRAASEAMLRWRFSPGRKNGRAVNTIIEMPMKFSLGTAT